MVYSDIDYNLWWIDQAKIAVEQTKLKVLDLTSNELADLNKIIDKLNFMYDKRKTEQSLSETRNT